MNEHFLITGARRGLGLALTQQLLERGCRVSVLVRNSSEGLDALQERFGERMGLHLGDVTSEESVRKVFEQVTEKLGHLDAIINNAVIYLDTPAPVLDELDVSICARTFEVNTAGPLRVAKYALPLVRKGNRKLMVNISSEAGSVGDCERTTEYAYCMSKSALNMGSKLMQNYLKPEGIKVLALHPGWFNSSGKGPAPISADQAALKVLETILKPHSVEDPIYLDSDGKPLPW